MHGHRQHPWIVGVDEKVVTAAYAVNPPALPLENTYELSGRNCRQALTHASIVRCSRSGFGTGRPSSASVSKYPAMASRTFARASSRDSP